VIERLVAIARQALETARPDWDAGDYDTAVNRSYYAANCAGTAEMKVCRQQSKKTVFLRLVA
jgi:uncharacterized protein (UPF0332 family)